MRTYGSFAEMVGSKKLIDDCRTGVYTVIPYQHDLEVNAAIREGVATGMVVSDGFSELRALDEPPRITSDEELRLVEALAGDHARVALRRVTLDNTVLEEIEVFAAEHQISVAEVISMAVTRWAERYRS